MTENIFLLCYEDDKKALISGFCAYLGVDPSGADHKLRLKNGSMEMHIRVATQQSEERFITEQREAVWRHFHAVPTTESTLKLNILHQISLFRSFIAVTYTYETPEEHDMIKQSLREMFKPLHALVLTDDGSALMNTDFQVIFNNQGKTQIGSFMPFAGPDAATAFPHEEPEKVLRRQKSLARLRQRNIYSLENLPLIMSSEEGSLRSLVEMAARTACLLTVALYSECLRKGSVKEAKKTLQNVRQRFLCDRYFSQKERAYLQTEAPEEKDAINFSWQHENLLVMEWAMGFSDRLEFPESVCDGAEVFSIMNQFDSFDAMLSQARVRTLNEILDEADFIYRLDWACVDARINNLDAPTGVEPGVVMERHKTLNWLISRDDWDEVDIST